MKVLRRISNKIKAAIMWIMSKELLDAINEGKTYEEVEAIAHKYDK